MSSMLAKQVNSRASMTLDVYSHVVTDPGGDGWRAFWLAAYDQQRRPRGAEASRGVVSLWSESEAAA